MASKAIAKVGPADKVEPLVKSRDWSALDEKIFSNAKKSLTEIAEITGLPANEVMNRMATLLEDRGWMTERMEERYLILQLQDTVQDARETLKLAKYDLENYASIANVVLKGLLQISMRFDQRKKIVDADLEKINKAYAQKMVDIVEAAAGRTIDRLAEKLSDTDREEIEAMLKDDLMIIARKVDKDEF